MSINSPAPVLQPMMNEEPTTPTPAAIPNDSTTNIIPELPAPRKTSSPLSSPSSSARGNNLSRHLGNTEGNEDGELGVDDIQGEMRSPATSSTLPLTDEEDEIGDEDSELTEEEEEEEEHDGIPQQQNHHDDIDDSDDSDENEEEMNGNIGKIRQPIFPTSRGGSQASTASLTPPPSDKSILSSPQESPKPLLQPQIAVADIDNDANVDAEEANEEEDGDITMRADPLNDLEDGERETQSLDDKKGILEGVADENLEEQDQKSEANNDNAFQEDSTEDPSPAEDEIGQEDDVDDEENEEQPMGEKIVIDEDEVDVEPMVEIAVAVEEPQIMEHEDTNNPPAEEEIDEGEQEQEEVEDREVADLPAYLTVPTHGKSSHSTHAPPPTSASMRALVMLELKFAALRDRLYIERMEEAAAEEEMILNGTHPALQYLYKTLSSRREKLHEVASRRHQQTIGELKRVRESEKHLIWSSWTEDRDRLHWDEFEQTWSKRRRLAREKNEIETPRIVKPVPKVGQPSTIRAFDWTAGATPNQLNRDDVINDLTLMEQNRRQYQTNRHNSPAMFSSQYHNAGQSSQGLKGATIYSYPQTQQAHELPQPRQNIVTQQQNHSQSAQQQQTHSQQQHTPINSHTTYPPRIVNAAGVKPYPPSQQSTAPQIQNQSQNQLQNQTQPVQRREGRTVPTTSDFFTGGPRRDSSLIGLAQKVKSPEEEPLSPIGLWSRGINGNINQNRKDGSSPKTSSSLSGIPTLSHNPTLGNNNHNSSLGLTHNQNPLSSSATASTIGGGIPGKPNSGGTTNTTATGMNTVKRSPTIIEAGRNVININGNLNGPIRSNSAGSASQTNNIDRNGTNSNSQQNQQGPPRSNSNPTTSINRPLSNTSGPGQNPNSRFASLADYLASSTAQPGTGLFGMGIGMGVGMGMGMGMGGLGTMGLGVPVGIGKNIGNVGGQNKARSPYQNGSASPAPASTNQTSSSNGPANNINKSTSPLPPTPTSTANATPPVSTTGTATTAGTNETRS
ncbi:uncharacterized protein L201_006256 [Kwoniella dendrophila CBS 6074]|uniref:Transcriptional regulatory protein RXT2 N-terminal domain-containing protein n=1 Tax=Kwoniella dendrophila CBS 6074 TaxID=1295534 RepID=A0AAX4K2B3_9TREE